MQLCRRRTHITYPYIYHAHFIMPFYYILLTIFPPLRMPVSNVLEPSRLIPSPAVRQLPPVLYPRQGCRHVSLQGNDEPKPSSSRSTQWPPTQTQHFSVHTTSHLQGNSDDSVDTNICKSLHRLEVHNGLQRLPSILYTVTPTISNNQCVVLYT